MRKVGKSEFVSMPRLPIYFFSSVANHNRFHIHLKQVQPLTAQTVHSPSPFLPPHPPSLPAPWSLSSSPSTIHSTGRLALPKQKIRQNGQLYRRTDP
ncbi:unnamed protein product [Tuber melanosporum]|uniref:(Perigord truffle) hypothetical protein n=1 Tax=Tuber melanosporum (strain Mel28) TaxID=656061 RepID=D5GER6_TUBMM|nr:uncharacterized protein GSTUM_00001344001 [Tuber melanosporum]CAZ83009.1 unnamed protein product [Tuber melanosporum]